jgi:hypothetical protein
MMIYRVPLRKLAGAKRMPFVRASYRRTDLVSIKTIRLDDETGETLGTTMAIGDDLLFGFRSNNTTNNNKTSA